MRTVFARLLFLIAVLGFPVQGAAAVTMALCDHDHGAQGHAHDADHGHASHDSDASPGNGDDPVPCHHCTAAALPCSSFDAGSVAGETHTAGLPPHLFLFFPEQPKRPPLA